MIHPKIEDQLKNIHVSDTCHSRSLLLIHQIQENIQLLFASQYLQHLQTFQSVLSSHSLNIFSLSICGKWSIFIDTWIKSCIAFEQQMSNARRQSMHNFKMESWILSECAFVINHNPKCESIFENFVGISDSLNFSFFGKRLCFLLRWWSKVPVEPRESILYGTLHFLHAT